MFIKGNSVLSVEVLRVSNRILVKKLLFTVLLSNSGQFLNDCLWIIKASVYFLFSSIKGNRTAIF